MHQRVSCNGDDIHIHYSLAIAIQNMDNAKQNFVMQKNSSLDIKLKEDNNKLHFLPFQLCFCD